MSRLGKLPIELPEGVQASFEGEVLKVKGPKGELKQTILPMVEVRIEDKQIIVIPKADSEVKKINAFWGLTWSLVRNMVIGVSEGFTKKLEINGVGYRAALVGRKLNLNLGFSHPVEFALAEGIDAVVEGNTITISGASKQLVGEMAAQIRKIRKPEPYKGKGVKYSDEIIRRKAGKAASKDK